MYAYPPIRPFAHLPIRPFAHLPDERLYGVCSDKAEEIKEEGGDIEKVHTTIDIGINTKVGHCGKTYAIMKYFGDQVSQRIQVEQSTQLSANTDCCLSIFLHLVPHQQYLASENIKVS
jgi:hypothetical protein